MRQSLNSLEEEAKILSEAYESRKYLKFYHHRVGTEKHSKRLNIGI